MKQHQLALYFNGNKHHPLLVVNSELYIYVQTNIFSKILWKKNDNFLDYSHYNTAVQGLMKQLWLGVRNKTYMISGNGLSTSVSEMAWNFNTNVLNTPKFIDELIATLLLAKKAFINIQSVSFDTIVEHLINAPTQKSIIDNNLSVYANWKLKINDTYTSTSMSTIMSVLRNHTLYTYTLGEMVEFDDCSIYTKYSYVLSYKNNKQTKVIVSNKLLLKMTFIKINDAFVSLYCLCRNANKYVPPTVTVKPTVTSNTNVKNSLINEFLDIKDNLSITYLFNNETDSYEKVYEVRITCGIVDSFIEVRTGKNNSKWQIIGPDALIKIQPK